MAEGKKKYFYSRENRKGFEGHQFFNPRFFAGVPEDAEAAVLVGEASQYEDIVEQYAEANIPLTIVSAGLPDAKIAEAIRAKPAAGKPSEPAK